MIEPMIATAIIAWLSAVIGFIIGAVWASLPKDEDYED